MIRGLFRMLRDHIHEVARAEAKGGERPSADATGEALAAARTVADLASRSSVYAGLDQLQGQPRRQPIAGLPSIPNQEAIDLLLEREPRLADTAEQVARAYERGAVTMIRAIDLKTVEHVQKRMATAMREGLPTEQAAAIIANDTDWPRSYARIVVRTNLATARSDGLMSAMRDPEVREMLPALEYQTAGDARVRATPEERAEARRLGRPAEDHRPLDGLVASVDWSGWDQWTPPGGFQCRCRLLPISTARLKRMGVDPQDGPWSPLGDVRTVLSRALFHPGFGSRASLHP